MELGIRIAKELGDSLYDELDVTRSDYDTLPAYEFYSKVEDSCAELRPDIIRKLEEDNGPGEMPWKTFENEKRARKFLVNYAKENIYLCLEILEDIFYNDWAYRVFAGGSFREIKTVWLNRAKETGKERFLDTVKHGNGKQVLSDGVRIENIRAFAVKFSPSYCFSYCLRKKILKKSNDGFYIEDRF